jgi:uncharacterized protein YbbC (DUF1343 family)
VSLKTGLDRILNRELPWLQSRKIGLVTSRASVDEQLRPAETVLAAMFPGQLVCLFSPQHGLWSEQQANMIETDHAIHPELKIPVYSLYHQTRRPTRDMLQKLDVLVIDLQDVGTRVYTFIWTMLYCLEDCAAANVPVVVLDRPNPITGSFIEGPLLRPQFRSFVGEVGIPMRHGLTIAELALLFNSWISSPCKLSVVSVANWNPDGDFSMTNRYWVPPSPNMPTVQTAFVYPGQVLLEGLNLSEGRGTTTPFEVFGAPFVQPDQLSRDLNAASLPGVRFLPLRFTPTFDKWQGQSCGAVAICVTDDRSFHALRTTMTILQRCRTLYGNQVDFLLPPYEYETVRPPIDIIAGSDCFRRWLESEAHTDTELPDELWRADVAGWERLTSEFKLYDRAFRDAIA